MPSETTSNAPALHNRSAPKSALFSARSSRKSERTLDTLSQSRQEERYLGIADHLARRGLSAKELASKVGAHSDSLGRLLQSLVAFGILKPEGEEQFSLTPSGEFLRTDVPGSLRSVVRFLVGPWAWRAFEELGHSVRTGQTAFDHVWGMSNFDYWERNPEVSKIHDEAMTGTTTLETARVLAAYDFLQFRTIVDIGGGSGALWLRS
jgi:C-methyltransferase